ILTSSNGVAWQRASIDSRDSFTAVSYGNGMFIAGSQTGAIFVSSDGYVWSQASVGLPGPVNGIAFGEGEFLAVTANGWFARSTNAITWTAEQLNAPTRPFTGVAFGDGTVVLSSIESLRGGAWCLPRNQSNWITTKFSQPK